VLLNIGIILVLAWGFWRGYRRGLVLQALTTIGYLAVWLIARVVAQPLASGISGMFSGGTQLNQSAGTVAANDAGAFFLNGLVFSSILTIGYFIVRHFARRVNRITRIPVLHQVNALLGGTINLVIRYVVVFIILNLLILLPIDSFQRRYDTAPVAQWIVKKTPGLSTEIHHWWLK